MVAAGAVVLVEALGPAFFADVRLPGAVNVPPHQVDGLARRLLPERDRTIVVYCSRACASAPQTARRLADLGYRDVRIYPGGKEEWVEAGLPVERDDSR